MPPKNIAHTIIKIIFLTGFIKFLRTLCFYKRILLGSEIINSNKALDFGSGDGAFIRFMSSNTFTIDALDPFFKAEDINQKTSTQN